ncbi:MAG: ribonuclease J [Oscillospiraceae bacterium]
MNQKQNKTAVEGQKRQTRQVKSAPKQANAAPAKTKTAGKPAAAKNAAPKAGTTKTETAARRPSRQSYYSPRRRPQEKPAVPIHIYPLGGLGEIGKNMTVYECSGDMMIVDCGSLFPESDMYGVDLVIPDFTFVEQNREKIRGIAITHGHEDHIGALPYLLREINLPIYATRLTIGLIQNKLEEHGLKGSTVLHLIEPSVKFKLGCFEITPIRVNHSIPDAVAFAIETPAGTIIQTGDFKVDYTPIGGGVIDLNSFAEYGKKGVLALLSDSTNSERPGMTVSESKVHESLQTLFSKATNQRILVATFASNLYRVQQIVDLAVESGRKVAISGRSMVNNTQMARELGYLKVPDNVIIDIDQINKYPPESVAIITTGSQGETLSALSRMAANSHRNVRVGPGDFIIISATPIPGNEKMVTKVVNGLLKLGAEVIYDKMYDVHASGHACQDEQKLMLELVRPKFFIPVHGEFKHLRRHAQTAEAMGVPKANIQIADTGDHIRVSTNGIALEEPIQAGALMVDGLGVGDVGSVVLRDRRLLSQDGIVVLSVCIDRESGEQITPVELFSRGFVYVRDSEELLEETRLAVQQVIEDGTGRSHQDLNSLKAKVREAASSLLYRRTKRSPMILPIVNEV